MSNVSVFTCNFTQSEVTSGNKNDGSTWTKRQLIATVGAVDGGDVLDLMVDPAKVNIFEPNLTRLQKHIDSLCQQDEVPTYFVTLFSVKPYKLTNSSTEMRAFRVPVPAEWVSGDEDRAINLAGKLCGKSFRLTEEDAINAFNELNTVAVNSIENQTVEGF